LKKIILITVIFTFIFNSHSQNFNFTNSHTALHVKDVDISADFYQKILRLKEMETPKGIPNTIRWFYLSDKTQIHLIQSKELIRMPKGIHISFATENLDAFIKHLKERNIRFENWYGVSKTTNMRGDNVKQIYFQDPDDYWIEVNNDVK